MVVILAGVTMNALFAWLLFTFLAAKNGRQIDPVTTVGRVVDELLPPEAAAFKTIQPGTRILSVNGQAGGVVGRDRGGHRHHARARDPAPARRRLDGDRRRSTRMPWSSGSRRRRRCSRIGRRWWVRSIRADRPAARASSRATRSPLSRAAGDAVVRPARAAAEEREPAALGRGGPGAGGGCSSTSRRTWTRSPGPTASPQAIGRIGVAVAGDFRFGAAAAWARRSIEGWHGRWARPPRSSAPCGGSSADGSRGGRSAGRS